MKIIHADFIVHDMARSLSFWSAGLGGRIVEDTIITGEAAKFASNDRADSMRMVLIALPTEGGPASLVELMEPKWRDAAMPAEPPKHVRSNITIAVGDFEATLALLASRGISPCCDLFEIELSYFGKSRVTFLRDPDGHLIELVGPPQKEQGDAAGGVGERVPATPEPKEAQDPDNQQEASKEELLRMDAWNAAAEVPYGHPTTLNQMFEAQVVRTPQQVALSYAGMQVGYAELNRRANRVAARLRAMGVGPDALVCLFVERSIAAISGLLGILKAGGAYLPLDPAHPQARLSFIIEDSCPTAIVTESALVERLPACAASLLLLDTPILDSAEPTSDDCDVDIQLEPERLAYVIYTSGSTGRPKGVMVSHANICNTQRWMQRIFPLQPADVVLQRIPLTFDASVNEIFHALLSGARLHICPEGRQGDGAYLVETIIAEKVTVVSFVPSMLRVFLLAPAVERCKSLKRVFCGGEALTAELADRFFQVLDASLINSYGPTETAVCATYWECRRGEHGTRIPIGCLLDNVQAYILNDGRRVPIGVVGELYLAGNGVARGYLNQPELSAKRFLPNQFGSGRMYRTGDLARYGDDGRLEYFGRTDHQVKIRGFRVELGEIEAVLCRHPEIVKAAVIVSAQDARQGNRIVAYVVFRDPERPALDAVRAFLKSQLPEYMIPSLFVPLQALPLTTSGKVDRLALASTISMPAMRDYEPPRTAAEEILARIWADILALPRVGRADDFFELGGDSLLAAQVAWQATDEGIPIKIHDIFRTPILAELAASAGASLPGSNPLSDSSEPNERSLAEIARQRAARPFHEPVELSYQQQLFWFEHLRGSRFHNPVRLSFQGRLDPQSLQRAITEIVRRQECLRTVFIADASRQQVMQAVTEAPAQVLEFVDLQALPAAERQAEAERIKRETEATEFDLEKGPFRAKLVRLGPESYELYMTLHSIVSDGQSWMVFCEELETLYNCYTTGKPSPLPELSIQFRDFAVLERRNTAGIQRQLELLRKQLGNAPALKLPLDRPRVGEKSMRLILTKCVIPAEVESALERICREQSVTLPIFLFATVNLFLSRLCAQEQILLWMIDAHRPYRELTRLIGKYVMFQPILTDFSATTTFAEMLRRVHETTTEARANSDVPAVFLLSDPVLSRLANLPLVVFNYLLPPSKMRLQDVAVTAEQVPDPFAIHDLLFVYEKRDDGLHLLISVSEDTFEKATVDALAASYIDLLRRLVSGPISQFLR